MNVTVRRQVRLLRRVGRAIPRQYQWGCQIQGIQGQLDVRITAPGGFNDADLDTPSRLLHDNLLGHIPPMLGTRARSEVGVVRTETKIRGRSASLRCHSYALAICADVVVSLVGHLSPELATHWRGTYPASDLDPELAVVLGPSAVLSLAAGALEMPEARQQVNDRGTVVPNWMSVYPVSLSPYPPHDAPPGIQDVPDEQRDNITYWAAHTEHWMRPMRTTRASRGQYEVHATLPRVRGGTALWVENLTSLDTRGRYWQASLSIGRDDGRWWLTQPWLVEVRAAELLEATVGQVEPARPALDRDPVDGESFGWAPALLTGYTVSMLGLRRCHT